LLIELYFQVGAAVIDLFQITDAKLSPLAKVAPKLEREIQRLLETNLETVFGIRFVASEFSTGPKHAGRIDTLGLDENDTPVIIEYKLTSGVNVVTQGLFYLDWLLDHKGDFEILVKKHLGSRTDIDWTEPRVMCVAESFSPYDLSAVEHLGLALQLVQFKLYESGLLLISVVRGARGAKAKKPATAKPPVAARSVQEHLERAKGPMRRIAEELRSYLLELGADVSESRAREYVAFRTTRNFCCLEVHQKHVLLHLRLDPSLGQGCSICTNVTDIGHFGTGNLRVRVSGPEDVSDAKRFVALAYEAASGSQT